MCMAKKPPPPCTGYTRVGFVETGGEELVLARDHLQCFEAELHVCNLKP
jgi:hypothetical protein